MARNYFLAIALTALGAPGVNAFWRMSCAVIQTGRIDPVISSGIASSHVHKISGANNININSTYDSLQEANCTSCSIQADKSAYWTPQLYYLHSNGEYEEVPNGGMAVYYLGRGIGADGSNAISFPKGLKFISGNNAARSYDSSTMTWGNGTYPPRPVADRVSMLCIDYVNNHAETPGITNTTCPDGFRAQIQMQSCWDGVNLYKSDQSHVNYLSQIDNGACPPTHPILLPHLFFEILYSVDSIDQTGGGEFVFANGDTTGYGFHGDFINGWDIPTLDNAVANCLTQIPDGVVEECSAFTATNIENYADVCPLQTPVFPCEQTSDTMSELPGCSLDKSTMTTTCPGGIPATCQANFNPTSPEPSEGYAGYQLTGCYTEATNERALSAKSYDNSTYMSAQDCIEFCDGYQYAGVEYSQECYCGNQLNPGSISTAASGCAMSCAGNQWEVCGGSSKLNVFQLVNSLPASSSLTGSTLTTSSVSSVSTISSVSTPTSTVASFTTPSSTPSTSTLPTKSFTASTITSALPTGVFPGNANFTWYNCVKEPSNSRALTTQLASLSTMTPELCLSLAAEYSWAGTEYGSECWAGVTINTGASNVSVSDCSMPCSGNSSLLCGAGNRLSMYSRTAALPPQPSIPAGSANYSFYACVNEQSNARALSKQFSDTTSVENCLALGAKYPYVGVEYGGQCFAGYSINLTASTNQSASDCNMLCSPGSLEYCGGSSRIQLYTYNGTTPLPPAPITCYEDNELRALESNSAAALTFCPTYTKTMSGAMATKTVPAFATAFSASAISSACTCFLSTASPSATGL